MRYQNPVVRGFYPDPSICAAEGKFYLVNSSFQYFPGVPLFESTDLVNYTQIGHVLSKKEQVYLEGVRSSGGVFAPTIRYHKGRFYMITNNNSTNENFYVWTDDIHGEWSDPIVVDQDGIDPSLLFDGDHVYFISNGEDENGVNGVRQCEINVETGERLTPSKLLWTGSGGRYIESPHMYKIGDWYYLMVAEGGTEYGHMITVARSKSVWGPFEGCPENPILTNRNKAPNIIQGIGHGDLVQNNDGNWYILCLGFRQIHLWQPYHHLGRECFLVPVTFTEDGWIKAGNDGTCEDFYEIPGGFSQNRKQDYTFENTDFSLDWIYLRHPNHENYKISKEQVILSGSPITLEEVSSPTFLGIRQLDFNMDCQVTCEIRPTNSFEAGLTLYMDEQQHYDIALTKEDDGTYVILKLNIGDIKHIQKKCKLDGDVATLIIRSDATHYHFFIKTEKEELFLGDAQTRYLSSEVASGFTGVVIGMYATGEGSALFKNFKKSYS